MCCHTMTTTDYEVSGETAIVTGASTGIGRAIAERFAADGVDVVVCSRSLEDLEEVAGAINDSDRPGTALAVECDITDWDAVEALAEATVDEFGGIDILVNNAGASFQAPFEEFSQNAWRTIVDINLNGTFNCTQVVGEYMRESGSGTVINISSVAGRDGAPQMSHYAASKAGMNNLTRTLAYEWAEYGVRVNGIMPGLIVTEGLESQMGISADEIDLEEVDRQIGVPDEIASVAQFLASPASKYILGETVTVEGVPRIARTRHHEE
ncbi:short-chain dehydrogenase/reductase SDR (plasmid) [Haloterrigena turkmenica DSM 5511]|uniref:Short-chain dehydrogenase/reductase SDR n=2 Tax=Haloterrigena turkmenica TaxID=62320 RepID=D2RZU4_HALTV|nr:short-chain dehydrogenase/reductase SDR [Haloterrigena turkmenica DSM 5511]